MKFSEFIKNEFDVFYKDEINKFLSDGYRPLLNMKSLVLFIQAKLNEFEFDNEETSVLYKILLTNDEQADILINSFNFGVELVPLKFKSGDGINRFCYFYTEGEYFFIKPADITIFKNRESEILIEYLKLALDGLEINKVVTLDEFGIESSIFKQIKLYLKENDYLYSFDVESISYKIRITKKPVGLFNNIKYGFSWK